jgi:hypothetical protein
MLPLPAIRLSPVFVQHDGQPEEICVWRVFIGDDPRPALVCETLAEATAFVGEFVIARGEVSEC